MTPEAERQGRNSKADILLVSRIMDAVNRYRTTDPRPNAINLQILSNDLDEWLQSKGTLVQIRGGVQVTESGITSARAEYAHDYSDAQPHLVFRARGKSKDARPRMNPTVEIKLTSKKNRLRPYDVAGISLILTPSLDIRQRGHAGTSYAILPTRIEGMQYQELNPADFITMYQRIHTLATGPIGVFPG